MTAKQVQKSVPKLSQRILTDLQGQIESITYTNDENGYTIAKIKVCGQRDLLTIGVIKQADSKNGDPVFAVAMPRHDERIPSPLRGPKPPHPIFLAQRFQQFLRSDKVNNQGELARIHCISRARVTHTMNLLKLPLEIRPQIVQMPSDEQEYVRGKKLREIVRLQYASKQMEAFEKLTSKFYG